MLRFTLPSLWEGQTRSGWGGRIALKAGMKLVLAAPSPLVLLATLPEGGWLLWDAFGKSGLKAQHQDLRLGLVLLIANEQPGPKCFTWRCQLLWLAHINQWLAEDFHLGCNS